MPCASSGRSSFAAPARQQRLVAQRLDLRLLLVGREPPARLEQARDLEALLAAEHEDDRGHVAGVRELAHRVDQHLLAVTRGRAGPCARATRRAAIGTRRVSSTHWQNCSGWPTVADRIDELGARIEPDDRLLPDVAALGVVEVVALVHHDDVGGRHVLVGDDPVPQDLGDLDLDRRLAVDLVVAGRESDVALAEVGAQLAVLLLGERAQRRRVDRALAAAERARAARPSPSASCRCRSAR